MVRKGAAARRSSKHGSHISAFKRLSLLDPAPPEPPPLQTDPSTADESPVCPDQVYLHAAAIFQRTHLEKPAAQRLISFGSRSEVSVPAARCEASQRLAYQLAFNTLKLKRIFSGDVCRILQLILKLCPSKLTPIYIHFLEPHPNSHSTADGQNQVLPYIMMINDYVSWVSYPQCNRSVRPIICCLNCLEMELLEDVLIDSCFCVSQPMPDGSMSLMAVMLTDLMDRKFLPRLQPANQEVKAVREVEACLLRFRTKLVASLARCRIKHDLLTLDNILPENIRHRQERATQLPLYAWINTLRISFEEVIEVLHTSGFSCVKSVGQLEGRTFCKDTHCHDLLVFPNSMKSELTSTRLLSDYRLVIQDKSCCVGPWALRPLLAEGGDVLMTGCFSAWTVAHVAAVVASARTHAETHTFSPSQSNAHGQSTVIVCLGDEPQSQTDELQNTLSKLGCKNVKLLSISLESLDVSDTRLQAVRVVVVMPACSLSAVSNPVDYIMQENRDPRLMLDLSHGSVSPEKLQTLACRQRKDLQRGVQFPQVRAVLYSTCSVHSEENEEVLETILSQSAPPYRVSSPGLLQDSITEDEDESQEMKASFFRLEASDHHNGCFLALLTRQPEPEVMETPQEVLARAAAKGLLDGLHPNQPIKKGGRRSRRAPASQARSKKTRPHATQSDQSRVAEFLNHEMKGSSSEPTVCHQSGSRTQSPQSPMRYDKPSSSRRLFQGVFSRTGSTPNPTGSTPNSTSFSSLYCNSLTGLNSAAESANNNHSSVPVAPSKGRQEVLRPATVMFPPVLLSNDGLLPQRRSHGSINPTHTHLQWSNSTPALPRAQMVFRARLNHMQPWLWHTHTPDA